MRKLSLYVMVLALSLPGLVSISAAQSPNPNALKAPPFAPDRVLVKFRPGTAASEIGVAHRQAKGQVLKTISGIGVQVVRVPAGTVLGKVAAYNANPNVEYAEPDFYRVLVIPNEEPGPTPAGGTNFFDEQWYLNNTGQLHTYVVQTIFGPILETTSGTDDADIDAPEGWEINQGLTTTDPTAYNTPKVAVLDSGADCDTLELQGKCLEQVNLVGLNPGFFELDMCSADKPACDNFGHGTFVASEVAANTNNGEGIAGAGWNTSFGVFKVCHQEIVTDGINLFLVGLCPISASAEAITLAATDQFDSGNNLLRSQYHVITMSYGSDLIDGGTGEITPTSPPNTECDAVLYAWNNGVVVVAGAGNNGDTNKFYPAACTDDPATGTGQSTVIAVAATDHNGDRASFSTYSTDVDDWVSLAAPGEAIIGVLPDFQCSLPSGTDTCVHWWDGTSMATPLVAGAAALVWTDLYQFGSVDAALAPADCKVDGVSCNQVVRQRLENGADKIGANGQDLQQWTRHGRLNVAGALAASGPMNYTLTVNNTGEGSGTVSSAPDGISCGADCTELYSDGTLVILTAEPDPGSSFSGWGGDCSNADTTTSVTMDADKNCQAIFALNPSGDLPPTASFSYTCMGLDCTFNGNASSDDNGIDTYHWNFGDGDTDTLSGSNAPHTYENAGVYSVTLTVKDTASQTNQTTVSVKVKDKGKTKGDSGGDDGGSNPGNCPPAKAAQGKC